MHLRFYGEPYLGEPKLGEPKLGEPKIGEPYNHITIYESNYFKIQFLLN